MFYGRLLLACGPALVVAPRPHTLAAWRCVMTLKIVIADGQSVILAGLAAWFENQEIEIVGRAINGPEALRQALEQAPNVLLADQYLPVYDALELVARLKDQGVQIPVLCYGISENQTHVTRASLLGAAGWVAKRAPRDELLNAIRCVAAGEPWWPVPRESVNDAAAALAFIPDAPPLTSREIDVLHQLSYGSSNKEIAKVLGISYETVKEHVQHILRKLGVSDRTQAAVWAVRNGIA